MKLDNGYLVKFYSHDINRIDSAYRFEFKFDTLINTNQVINYSTSDKITFAESTDSLTIALLDPKLEYLALFNKDTIIWGPDYPNQSITIQKDHSLLLDSFFVQNWGIIALGDTIGSNGVQTNRLIKTHWNSSR